MIFHAKAVRFEPYLCAICLNVAFVFCFCIFASMPNAITSLLHRAIDLHKQGQLSAAEDLYVQILQIDARQFDALHLIGVIAQQRGDLQSALNFFGKALAVDTQQAKLHCNLGACLHQLERHMEALSCYELALQLQQDYILAWINRGNVLRSLERFEEAIHSYEKAMDLQIDEAEAYYQRGLTLQTMGLHDDALLDFEDGLRWRPQEGRWHFARGVSYQQLGMKEEAQKAYLACLQLEPGHSSAYCNLAIIAKQLGDLELALSHCEQAIAIQHRFARAHLQHGHILKLMHRPQAAAAAYRTAAECGIDPKHIAFLLASLGQAEVPEAAPSAYVRDLFDQYARHFDTHLQQQLQYQVPQLLEAAIARHLPQPVSTSLDLGCGTGLCGQFLKARSQHLIGVDISPAMLERAAQASLYDRLVCADIQDFLKQEATRFDLIVMADVLVYFGKLDSLLASCVAHLNAGAHLAFSVEKCEEGDYQLQHSQRFAHTSAYLEAIATAQGWRILEMRQQESRREGEQMVQALVCVWQKP